MTTNLQALIDQFGELKAQKAELELAEKALRQALDELAPGAYEGLRFRLSISETERATLDMDAVREHLSRQFIAAHTNVTKVRTLRASARSAKNLAA